MNIAKAEIFKISLPLISVFRTGFGELKKRELLWLKIIDKTGIVAYGESANLDLPIYEPEFNDATALLLKNVFLPRLIDKQIPGIEDLEQLFSDIKGNNFAKAAVDAAFWHYKMQTTDKPLYQLWGGTKLLIPVAVSIGLGRTTDESVRKVLEHIKRFRPKRVKIKIKPGIDIQLIAKIRKHYPTLPIMVDANASYTLRNIKYLKKLDDFGLLMIEQPLRFDDLADHAYLQKELKTKICLDESIRSFHDAEQAIRLGSCQIVNIKPQRVGGYWQAKKIAALCRKHSIPVWCGGMIESGWGQIFNASIATLPNFTYENDICLTKWYLKDDILKNPIEENNGLVDVGKLSFELNEKKLKKYTTQKLKIN